MGKYDNLLSPIMVGNHLFKNRIIATPTTPEFLQETENYPSEGVINHYVTRARNGAALVAVSGLYEFDENNPTPYPMRDYFSFDMYAHENHYLSQLVEGIHAYGSFATIQLQHKRRADWDICKGAKPFDATFIPGVKPAEHEMTPYELQASTEQLVKDCMKLKQIGFDGVFLHMSYQFTCLGRTLSPIINKRTDQYGGSFENRLRLTRETCQAIKDACGKDFIIESHITGEEREYFTGELIPGGWSIQDTINFAEEMSGLIDILHLRGWNVDAQHPSWLRPDEPPYLYLAEAAMAAKTETRILTTSGHKNPDQMEKIIAEGKADLVGIARSLIADPQFVQKIYEDRVDDIRPCIRCNRCFEWGHDGRDPRTSRCAINPAFGMEHRMNNFVIPPTEKKKIVIAGGGPAGMEAALVAKSRGHEVTLVEKSGVLGGQLNIADHSQDKWALRQYRDFLTHQIEKQGVDVKFNTAVDAQYVKDGGYDVVIAALGSAPTIPDIPGIHDENVVDVMKVYGGEEALGQRVVVMGGACTGVETGMHLARDFGRDVVVLGRNAEICKDAPPTHYMSVLTSDISKIQNLDVRTSANVTAITSEGVVYVDAEGVEQLVPCDSVVVAVGMTPRKKEAMDLYTGDARLIVIGDNRKAGNIMDLVRDAYFAASQI